MCFLFFNICFFSFLYNRRVCPYFHTFYQTEITLFQHIFYSSGVVLPGETLRFPFVFKSECAGVFTEQWLLETRPVLCGGAALALTLRGVALQEDKYEKQRQELEVSQQKNSPHLLTH